MWLIRNSDVKKLLAVILILVLAGSCFSLLVDVVAGILTFLMGLCILILVYLYLYSRNKKIARLCDYLKRMNNGEKALELRDNEEGELSILKSEIYKTTLQLREQASQLQDEKLYLADSLSDISHQLKTPLTSMFVMTDLLSDDKLEPEKRKEFLEVITSQLQRIQWLVTSLLKLSKLDAGTVEFRPTQADLYQLVGKALEPVMIPMELKGQILEMAENRHFSMRCDFNWTVEALVNILKNCVEHTAEKGKITISFEDNPFYTAISISDNGSGISKRDLPYIFKRFYKGENASEDSIGIGLAMSKAIVTSQGGALEVKSQEGVGTKFLVKMYKV